MFNLKLAIMFILFLISCSCSTERTQNNQNYLDQSWYITAMEYINYDKVIINNNIKNFDKFNEILRLKQNAAIELVKSSPPRNYELEEILVSSVTLTRQIGLVNIMVRDLYSKELYKIILNILWADNGYLTRYYSYNCINLLNNDDLNGFSSDLLDILMFENYDGLIVVAMPSVLKIDNPKLIDLFVKLISSGSPTLKEIALVNLSNIKEKYRAAIEQKLGIGGCP